ncbi:MAG: acyl-CoA thioesterase II [Myxococcales bacterium]|nr:acyl-CoA thioesterase II [Myxococcales bacterium]MCB9544856.1 acyl-CoA thioesterase II [Myxococcales bacterium]
MTEVLQHLIALLGLERIEQNLFRGQSQDLGWGRVFGGQVLGQALSAAVQTVPPERAVHSFHGYFMRPGAVDRPIVYDVDRIRDGGSFTTRRVVAIQNGEAIFSLSASFQIEEEGFEHQDEMPAVPGPEGLLSERDLALRVADKLPPGLREQACAERPIEVRPVEPMNPLKPDRRPPQRAVWYRASGPLPDDAGLHRYLLAYASDFNFMTTALMPHGVSWISPGMQVASLDHAMWFHRPFRMDEWILHVVESPSASGARGLARGRFYTQDGRLVASTAQEGLIRQRKPRPRD